MSKSESGSNSTVFRYPSMSFAIVSHDISTCRKKIVDCKRELQSLRSDTCQEIMTISCLRLSLSPNNDRPRVHGSDGDIKDLVGGNLVHLRYAAGIKVYGGRYRSSLRGLNAA